MATGINTATAAVLLMKAEMIPTTRSRSMEAFHLEPPVRSAIRYPSLVTRPLCTRLALSTNIIMTVTTAGLLKPEVASSGVINPKRSSSPEQTIAITAMFIHSRTKARMVKTMMASRIRMSVVSSISAVVPVAQSEGPEFSNAGALR